MAKRKKATRRNSGGRRSVAQPPGIGVPSVAELERDMQVTQMAMDIARDRSMRSMWMNY